MTNKSLVGHGTEGFKLLEPTKNEAASQHWLRSLYHLIPLQLRFFGSGIIMTKDF